MSSLEEWKASNFYCEVCKTHWANYVNHVPNSTECVNASRGVTLELDAYERDNLLAALLAIAGFGGPSPLSAANTGDWVMQLAFKLNYANDATDYGRPNKSHHEIVSEIMER